MGSSLAGIWVAGEVISGRTVATWNFVEATGKRETVVMFFEKSISSDDIVKMFRERHRSKKIWRSKKMSREVLLRAFTDKKEEVDLYGENHFHDGG